MFFGMLYVGAMLRPIMGPIPHDAKVYRGHHKIENMFGRLNDWCRVATRDDRCHIIFLSAIAIAATVLF